MDKSKSKAENLFILLTLGPMFLMMVVGALYHVAEVIVVILGPFVRWAERF